ncbi:hypothetical protein PR048_011115 [Dryococelus australis]|uniref:Zinc finger BED domain-containing protein 5 n=1 Tax=Dryococelus australis TaxID=614101 RepID=A0ABQ9HL90_9NEOP|nr:hypothetical protein PR048_011115 [Dryococelus australis]
MGSHHQSLLLYTEVRWFSHGKALTSLMELHAEVTEFLMEHNAPLATVLNDEDWVCKLAHLADIFRKIKLVLLPFSTTELCEAGFLAYMATKIKYRSHLNAQPDICLQLSSIIPEIRKLCKKMQPNVSHSD